MSLMPFLPEPLENKISGWDLPPSVLSAFLKMVRQKLEDFPVEVHTRCMTYEFSVPDPSGNHDHAFYGRVAGRNDGDDFVLVDCDFDWVQMSD